MKMQRKIFKIDNNFYSDNSIKIACNIFSENYDIKYSSWEISFENSEDVDKLYLEFMNYLLYLEFNENEWII